jgi:hypothetical protein
VSAFAKPDGGGAVTLTAGGTLLATVTVLDGTEVAHLASLSPTDAGLSPGGTLHFTVGLDAPAGDGGVVVAIGQSGTDQDGGAVAVPGTVPATVTVPARAVSAGFDYVDSRLARDVHVTATVGSTTLTSHIAMSALPTSGLIINEVDYDQPGNDNTEFLEILNASGAPVDLSDYKLLFINGTNNAVYLTVDLTPGGTLQNGQYLVAVSSAALAITDGGVSLPTGTPTVTIASGVIQNGNPDGIALVQVSTATVVDSLSYEGAMNAAILGSPWGTVDLVHGTVLPATVADSNTDPGSLCRLPDGANTHNDAVDWSFCATPTPGAPNQH